MELHEVSIESLSLSNIAETAVTRCQLARKLEETGEFDLAREALGSLWPQVGQRPQIEGLPEDGKAELLLRAGTLTGWIGSAHQIPGSQEAAKDLISESATIFEGLGLMEKTAEARVNLATCYWREGAFDEARVTLRHSLECLRALESEQRLRALLSSALVERSAARLDEALRIHRESAPLFSKSSNYALKGKFHSEYATLLKNLGLSENRQDYIDQALIEFAAASVHYEQVGHKRFQAGVENNEGFLFASLGKFTDAHQHLDRARLLYQSLKDKGGVARVDETRAQTLLFQGRAREAERFAKSAVQVFEQGGEQSALAEALTTRGKALARLDRYDQAHMTLKRAIEVAQVAGDPDSGGIAALTTVEELRAQLPLDSLKSYYCTAESLLASSQHRRIGIRLGECARRLIAAEGVNEAKGDASSKSMTPSALSIEGNGSGQDANLEEQCSLEAEVHRYESSLIRKALETSGGSVTRAARLLGITHQGLAFILNGRHSDLLSVRTPVKRRRRSIIRYH
jgi:tetratricopeptide (TPR) repeat protein